MLSRTLFPANAPQTPSRLTPRESLLLTAFSFLYTINIAVSNISLQLVTVPFHQVVRATTPLFIIAVSYLLLSHSLSSAKLLSLIPVVVGVGFATYGDYYFTLWGLLLTLLGTVLAAFKTIITHLLQTGHSIVTPTPRRSIWARILPPQPLKLHPLDLLLRMSPLAFIQCVVYAHLSGELEGVHAYGAREMDSHKAAALLVNGAMAFGLNVVSFTANSKVGPLSITVAGPSSPSFPISSHLSSHSEREASSHHPSCRLHLQSYHYPSKRVRHCPHPLWWRMVRRR